MAPGMTVTTDFTDGIEVAVFGGHSERSGKSSDTWSTVPGPRRVDA